jgi:hypothetical protein
MRILLLSMLLMVGAAAAAAAAASPFRVQVKRVNNTLEFYAPKMVDAKYGEVWIQPASSVVESLSPNSWRIVSDATSGTFSVVICGDGFCRIEECDWSCRDYTWAWWSGVTAFILFLLWGIWRTCIQVDP